MSQLKTYYMSFCPIRDVVCACIASCWVSMLRILLFGNGVTLHPHLHPASVVAVEAFLTSIEIASDLAESGGDLY